MFLDHLTGHAHMFKKQYLHCSSNFPEEESQGILESIPVLHLVVNKPVHWEGKWDLAKVIVNVGIRNFPAPCLAVDNKQVVSFPFLSL